MTAVLRLVCLLLWPGIAVAQPVEIGHVWGTTRIEARLERIVTLSYNGADNWLALGVRPMAYRVWYGGDDSGLWPWAAPMLDTVGKTESAPVQLRGEIDLEAVARLEPDLIEAMYSGLTRSQYNALSRIAPVLAPPPGAGDFGASWRSMIATFGRAVGREAKAAEVIAGVEAQFEGIRRAHPDWKEKTAVVAMPDGPLVLTRSDVRTDVVTALGFDMPEAAQRLDRGGFFYRLDRELTAPLEADVVIWLDLGGGVDAVRHHPLRATMRAPREGREIVADPDLSAALSYASALSLDYALERLVPLLEQAADGDPETRVGPSEEAGLWR
ncbi:iron complex transport system substrate-binding protein [Roseovarius pacificus]|uniref:Iron complex transport system substrate-binding protein n=1 Tax=Roseovarius pacificus TaxID=337701 RepID=A0A1M7A5R6_9RHOB|nr:ABC transporter substrate-binding protein [Roseovarius pacificus]GGO53860.1 ABC transporter substrate-binding protein [Roseovarius pacificus]SHL37990.1 iron complex transport system substrate-binding protein [Roseovarius pacificus]